MKIFVKNMVCSRCIMVVKEQLEKLKLNVLKVDLGEVDIKGEISKLQKEQLSNTLAKFGFALIDDKKSRLIEKIKNTIVELVHYSEEHLKTNLSDYLGQKLNHDYNHLSSLFSDVEGTTIEQYLIAQKIERVKELLVYDELSLSEIAFQLGYSSVSHLSKQFKKVTGLTPSHFKKIKNKKRKPLEDI